MITIIHNVYKRNPLILETIKLNLLALNLAKAEYQYIVWNDKGDKEIENDISSIINNVDYIYSNVNYGLKMATGGWVGAIPYVDGDIIHNIGQDDVLTGLFYEDAIKTFEDKDLMFYTSNGYSVDEQLNFISIMINPALYHDYRQPFEAFVQWFGIQNEEDVVHVAHNYFLASGTLYRKSLHELVGIPDVATYTGAADFEYWARILFNYYKGRYNQLPNWCYRKSRYTAGNEIIDGLINRGTEENPGHQQIAIEKVKNKYSKLWEERKRKDKNLQKFNFNR